MTPMMLQYFEVKNKYKEYILMYRIGDFYEDVFRRRENRRARA